MSDVLIQFIRTKVLDKRFAQDGVVTLWKSGPKPEHELQPTTSNLKMKNKTNKRDKPY